jgi:hypothetical protein
MESLTDLITVAQSLLDAGFDFQAFLTWKSLAFISLLGLLGPLHYYTKIFCRVTEVADHNHLMAGEGVLVAIREGLSQSTEPPRRGSQLESRESQSASLFLTRCGRKWCSLRLAQEAYRGE